MKIIPYKKFWLGFSLLMLVPCLIFLLLYGLRLSADFNEGTLFSLKFKSEQPPVPVSSEQMRTTLESFIPAEGEEPIRSADIKKSAEDAFFVRLKRLKPNESDALLAHIRSSLGDFELLELRDVSPIFAKTFRDRSLLAVAVASLMILLYITFAFRKVSRGIQPWKMGLSAIVALFHDVFIIVGIFAFLGKFFQVEVDALFITAVLSVMGFSVHDTIVVFDRVRENLLKKEYTETFEEVADRSVLQTLARSFNISFSAVLVLTPLLLFGAQEIYYFILALTLGIIIGTYSSIFVATPLLTIFQKSS